MAASLPSEPDDLPQADGDSVDEPRNRGGLYDGFEAYRTPTDADYADLFADGMIVLDTNVLIDLYRYHKKTRDEFLLVLDNLKERVWLPHQVVKEFWSNRDNVLRDPREVDKTARELSKNSATAYRDIRTWAKRVRLPADHSENLTDTLAKAFAEVITRVREIGVDDGREFARDTTNDPLLLALEAIIDGRVGAAFDQDEQTRVIAEARRRSKTRIPPGYMDCGKEGTGPTGDYVLWAQLLKESERRHVDVLFVTSDDKEDWWRKDRDDESLGPRPELVEELRAIAGVRLFMLPPDSLLDRAGEVLELPVSEEAVQDVKQVSGRAFKPTNLSDNRQAQLRQSTARMVHAMTLLNDREPTALTVAALHRHVDELADALSQPTLPFLLESVWALLEHADASAGDASNFGEGVWRPSNLEREVWVAMDALRANAIQSWLENAADEHIGGHADRLDTSFGDIELPPGVVAVNSKVYGREADVIDKVEFTATLKDGRQFITQRAIAPM